MTSSELMTMLKRDIGITTYKQDERLAFILQSVRDELQERQGIVLLPETRTDHAMFLLDYAKYRYTNQREPMPEHLRWRLRNLYVGEGHGI